MATNQYDFIVTLHDLEFILKQIQISFGATNPDGSVNGALLAELVGNPLLPYGLRTVDGSWNSLLGPDYQYQGAADQVMPRLTNPNWKPAEYGGTYEKSGFVIDSEPREISNLISDQTANNPAAQEAFDALLKAGVPGSGVIEANETLNIPNMSPDIGLSPAFNSWMTFFGQFFDHGLDLIPKADNGVVMIPLHPDDPLYVEGSATNFMMLTRAKVDANHDTVNLTTPYVDQNQTYTSHPSHQVFLREYKWGVDAEGNKIPVPTGELLAGAHGLANWAEVKAQALEYLGIELTDIDILNVPLLLTDAYGGLILSAHGKVQIAVEVAPGMFDYVEVGANGSALLPTNVAHTGHAFLDDIAHNALPVSQGGAALTADADSDVSTADQPQAPGTYDNELLDRHFMTGDGRGNENIGLTTVHAIFHSEHNRLVEQFKETLLNSGDVALVNQWLTTTITSIPTDAAGIDTLDWNGEYLFQAGRFVTEMEYQHLVFEEFARTVQPGIDPFVFSHTADIDPAIVAEFANVVYRFGHSMLNEEITRTDANMTGEDIGLVEAFLNPVAFDELGGQQVSEEEAIGAMVRGMTRQVGNEIDEFITGALRNNLLGLPLDLGALNIARGRDTGMPTLNQARAQFYEMSSNSQLKPYESWADFASHLKHPLSVINFIAAYGQHPWILNAMTLEEKRDAALALLGTEDGVAFFTGTGAWANKETGLNMIDFWIGGLAEQKSEFGGMLGSTFNYVFETQLENLQNGDRYYYLSRTEGLNLLNQLEANSFATLVMRNSDLGDEGSSHISAHLFQTPDLILELNQKVQMDQDPSWNTGNAANDALMNLLKPLLIRQAPGADVDGDGKADGGYLHYTGNAHVVLGGTAGNDTLIGGKGIDSLWGDAGDDYLDGGDEADVVHGGDGDDIITDGFTPVGAADLLYGDNGNDVISSGNGNDLVFGGAGTDFIILGTDNQEAFGGLDNDFILGGTGSDTLMGNEGDDWIEGGEGFDYLAGDNSELFFNSTIIGNDVLNGQGNDTDYDGEAGDDIMIQGPGIQRNNGMAGFDWAIHKGDPVAANSDLGLPIFANQQDLILRDRFDLTEGLSGWIYDDVLIGTDLPVGTARTTDPTAQLNNLTQAGVDRINGLQAVVGGTHSDNPDFIVINPDNGANILLGGGGSDIITGKGGDDIIDGDAWLNVRISVRDLTGVEIRSVDSMNELKAQMLSRELNPGQLIIVREIRYSETSSTDIDSAIYRDVRANYDITKNADGSWTVAHTRPDQNLGVNDGTDRVRNIERLVFTDQDVWLNLNNSHTTGSIRIDDTTPTAHRMLSAHPTSLMDQDGLMAAVYSYQWQMNTGDGFVDIADATEITYTPTVAQAQVAAILRVVMTVTDDNGFNTALISTPTAPVGDWQQGDGGRNILIGTAYADWLQGQDGDDTLYGQAGDDLLEGGNGNDILDGGIGADAMIGGAGNDVYRVNNIGDMVTEDLDSGTDVVEVSLTNYTLPSNVENLVFAGANNVDFTGVGNASANTITGKAGADTLNGLAGNDILNGGAGNDILNGGTGNDILNGGSGNDIFVFGEVGNRNFGQDRIMAFDSNPNGGQDRIDIHLLGITAATFTSLVHIEQVGSDTVVSFTDAPDTITLLGVNNSGQTIVDGNDFIFAS